MYSTKLFQAVQELDPKTQRVILTLMREIERRQEETITRKEFRDFAQRTQENFDKVWKAIQELAEAQRRGEERMARLEEQVAKLAEAQRRGEERMARLEEQVAKLTEAQRRGEERMARLEEQVAKLAEAQRRSEERMEREFARVWKTIQELTEAQRRTEQRLEKLIEEHRKTREQLGGLSDTFGYYLENRAIRRLPEVLKKRFGIEVVGSLQRGYLKVGKTYVELNIYGQVRKGEREYTLVGEAKNRLNKRAVADFVRKCEKLGGDQIRVLVAHLLPPQLEELLKREGILFVNSYEVDY